jgi:FkbM family methyltransferase
MFKPLADTLSFILRHPISGRTPLRSLLRWANWQVRSRTTDEVPVPWIGDTRLIVRAGMSGATGNIYCGLHEYPEMAFALHMLRPGDLFCDAGANIGSYTVLASGVVGATTIAIEAAPETVGHLRRNIEANGIAGLVEVHEVLIGPAVGQGYFSSGSDSTNRVIDEGGKGARVLPMTTLDTILGGRCPIMMKMDIEGFEESALAGAERMLSDERLQSVCIELFSDTVADLFERHGFTRAYYDPANRALSAAPNGVSHSNALLVRGVERVAERLRSAPVVRVFGRPV